MTAITIERFDTHIVDLPTLRPHKLAMHTLQGQTLVILRIYCSDGIVGVGEATTIGGLAYAGESPESIKVNLGKWFAPLLNGQDASASVRVDINQAWSEAVAVRACHLLADAGGDIVAP